MTSLRRRAKRKDPSVAYSVYIFHRPVHQNDNHITWEKRHTTSSLRVAYRQAETLFNSQEYDRVEIKKIFFDPRADRKKDKTLKIYQYRKNRPVGMFGRTLLYLMAACSFAGLLWVRLKTFT